MIFSVKNNISDTIAIVRKRGQCASEILIQELAPDLMPSDTELPDFRYFVRKGQIKSTLIEGVEHVSFADAQAYFQSNPQTEEEDEWEADDDLDEETEATAAPSRGKVSISMSDYADEEAWSEVLDTLTAQGFEVEVKP